MVVSAEQVECPVCGQNTDIHDLGRAGLTTDELLRLRQYIKDGTLGKMLTMSEIVLQRLDPTSTSVELSVSEALMKLSTMVGEKMDQNNRVLSGISEKIAGPGIGEVFEMITTEELRQAFSQDEFDTTQAQKHGTDIIATVYERKNQVGKISISVKDTKVWTNEFIEQLEKNMKQDSTRVGILVSKKLPKRVNPTGEVFHNNGYLYFLVHPQYMKAIYGALRQVVIHIHDTDQYIVSKEQELMRIGHISKALAQWISGSEYQEIVNILEQINEASVETVEDLQQTENYVERQMKKACEKQRKIQKQILNQKSLLKGLTDLLKSPIESEKE